ncbi:transposase [Planctomicrobium piriforme]|uniref:Transposase DDE domain-containing protein n=1 Tax=Planctomicrobium piriforme TaxID=1576369 RepID=A0A1I3TMK6_9PLAN|nr:transposase [Planctomicrobium piriforme]SFJ71860.1 Transposase DDE domain-containing protein [Planctomicrobium piriforme]
MDGFQKELLDRLPLAEAAWTLFQFVAGPEILDAVFERHRGRAYEGRISFSTLVTLMSDALLVHSGSGRQSFQQARHEGLLETTDAAAYGKLRRVPVAVSEALLSEVSDRLREVQPAVLARHLPASLELFTVLHIDGKKIKQLAKRLKPLRGVSGSMLGGKALVALEGRSGIAVAMAATLDGEANDAPLVPALIPQVRARLPGLRLWVADRQFCDLRIPALLSEHQDAFLIRHCLKLIFHPDPETAVSESRDEQGRQIRDEEGWIGSSRDPRRMRVRRLTLERPGEEAIMVLTNLLDRSSAPAADLLQVYRERWQIERVFQQVTEVFQLQRLIGSSPQAAVFQASFCLVLYNVLQTIRGYIAEAQQTAAETISTELLFRDVQRQLVCWTELGNEPLPRRVVQLRRDGQSTVAHLQNLLRNQWSEGWRKSPPKKRWQTTNKTKVPGGHSSAWKLLQKRKDDSS